MTQSKLRFSGDIKDYRQPMVTSLGIILGFLLNFLASWSAESDAEAAIQTPSDWLIVSSLLKIMAALVAMTVTNTSIFIKPTVKACT